MDLLFEAKTRNLNYNTLKGNCIFNLVDNRKVDISVIIPVLNRTHFNKITVQHFKDSISYLNTKTALRKKISITIVEHSNKPEHQDLCKDNVNYIWIPQNGGKFNKCLCHNMGALYSNRCSYFLFHDLDILVPRTFFLNLLLNLKDHNALQAFTGRRVLYCSKALTDCILKSAAHSEKHTQGANEEDLVQGQPGAPGGSILVEYSTFLNIGGYDAEFFTEYSIEDQFFFDKIKLISKLGFCNYPPIELIHLWHEPSFNQQTKTEDFSVFYSFARLDEEKKKKFIKLRADIFKAYA